MGVKYPFVDERSKMKFDPTPREAQLKTLAPNESAELFNEKIVLKSNSHYLKWGPWRSKSIDPGPYILQVEWESQINTFYNDTTNSMESVDIWLSENPVQSNIINIVFE